MAITLNSENDLTVAKQTMLYNVFNIDIYGDKAFKVATSEASMKQNYGISIITPVRACLIFS